MRPERTVAVSLVGMGAAMLAMAATDTWLVVLVGAAVVDADAVVSSVVPAELPPLEQAARGR